MTFMLLGKYERAWQESDAIRRRGRPDPHRYWQGEDVRGKRVVIRCLHGFGDLIQGLRYAPLLSRLASSVTWEVPPRMRELIGYADGITSITDWSSPPSSWDVQVEVTELPYLFRTRVADLPIAEHFLRLPGHVLQQHSITGRGPRIGVVWAAGEWDPARSVPLPLLQPLVARSSGTLINLQGSDRCAEWPGLRRCGDGPVTLAATIAQLDLVITVDTFAAHLAGALGVPGWLLLQHAADWRWMAEGDRSPWYPSLRLFRQPAPGDWAGVVRQLSEALTSGQGGIDRGRTLTSAA